MSMRYRSCLFKLLSGRAASAQLPQWLAPGDLQSSAHPLLARPRVAHISTNVGHRAIRRSSSSVTHVQDASSTNASLLQAAGPSQDSPPGSQLVLWLSCAAACAAAACTGFGSDVSHCDSKGSLAAAQAAVDEAWKHVLDDVHRADAEAPLQGVETPPVRAPRVDSAGSSTVVTVPVRQSVDLHSLERALTKIHMDAQSAHDGARRGFSFASSSVKMSSSSNGQLSVHLRGKRYEMSLTCDRATGSSDAEATVSLTFGSSLGERDVALLTAVLRVANTQRPAATRQRIGAYDELGSQLDDMWQRAAPFSRTLSGLADLDQELALSFEALEQMLREHGPQRLEQGREHRDDASARVPPSPADVRAQRVRALEELGALVYLPGAGNALDWGAMAGYEEQKQTVEDLVLLSVTHAEEYSKMAQITRKDGKCAGPKAVLFEGPPGTGKTTCARIVASQAKVPLVYIPVESVASKWYGESEKMLSDMLNTAESLGGSIVFIDEVDSLATSRGDNMNEATRRLLGVLLRFIDGFQATDSLVIAATNRKQDLDAALLSRCDAIVSFDLPDAACRADILQHYAAHLPPQALKRVADVAHGMSARDLRAICEVTERRWVSSIVRGECPAGSLPPVSAYLAAAQARGATMVAATQGG